MKGLKPYLSLFAGLLIASAVIAQTDSSKFDYVRQGKSSNSLSASNFVYAGFGLGGIYPYSGPRYSETPNITLMFEKTAFNHLGPGYLNFGALASFKGISSGFIDETTNYTYTQNWNYYVMGARCTYHIRLPVSLDIEPYVGMMEAYNITSFHFISNDPNSTETTSPGYYLEHNAYPNYLSFTAFAGARSYLSTRASIWAEVGYGYTSVAFGLCYKI